MNDDELISQGLQAFAQIQRSNKRGFNSWIAVAEGIEAGKRKLMDRLKINRLDGSIGKRAYSLWLKESGYDAVPAVERTMLAKIVRPDNFPQIRLWYAKLSDTQKLRWNHPATIWRNWQNSIGTKPRSGPIVMTAPAKEDLVQRTSGNPATVRSDEHFVLVTMTADSNGNIVHRISDDTGTAQLADYIGLAVVLIGFLAQRHQQSPAEIQKLIATTMKRGRQEAAD